MDAAGFNIYQMTEERQKELWSDCVFVFDTSALLALYLYPEEARQQIYTEIFERIKGRLWIPHHVLFEYLKNKDAKIREPISRSYQPLNDEYVKPVMDSFNKSLNRIDALKNNIKNANTHPHIVSEELEKYEKRLKEFIHATAEFGRIFNEQTEQKINEILRLEQHDTVFENIQKYFKVGNEYSYAEILKITLEGKHRYEFKIPPGYEDLKDKIGTQIFGDLIIWKQMLEYAKENKKNIVFICNDVKEDWWHLASDRKGEKKKGNGPRKELIKEMKDYSGSVFWMYNQARFLDVANTLIKSNVLSRYIEQMSRLIVSGALDKTLVYICDHCSQQHSIDTAALQLKFESVKPEPSTHQKTENKYLASDTFHCRNCKHSITAIFEVWEHPMGVISHQHTSLKGAALVRENPVEEERLLNDYPDADAGLEEIILVEKKQLRLKAGKKRKLVLKKPADASQALFQVEYLRPNDKILNKRLLVEAFNAQKEKIIRTLVMERGMTSFVLHSENDSFGQLISVVFTPNIDMTLLLNITEYPGSGHYLEKLYY